MNLEHRLFFLDIETTDASNRCEILELSIVEALYDEKDCLYVPKRKYSRVFFYGGQPATDFARRHHRALYALCNEANFEYSNEIRTEIVEFLKSCSAIGKQVIFAGRNLEGFDLKHLHRKGYLNAPETKEAAPGNQAFTGDHHYRVFNMSAVERFVRQLYNYGDNEFIASIYPLEGPLSDSQEGIDFFESSHRAEADNLREIARLNHLLKHCRNVKPDPINFRQKQAEQVEAWRKLSKEEKDALQKKQSEESVKPTDLQSSPKPSNTSKTFSSKS